MKRQTNDSKPTEFSSKNGELSEPIFLVHGWNMPPGIWSRMIQELGRLDPLLEAVNATMPGYDTEIAASSVSQRVVTEESEGNARSLEEILEETLSGLLDQAPESAHWCGWSLGATLAMVAAVRFPRRVSKLTLISPTPLFCQQDDWPHGMPSATFEKLLRITCRKPAFGWQRFIDLQLPVPDQDKPNSKPKIANPPSQPEPPTNFPLENALVDGKRILCELDLRDTITSIDVDTLVLAGHQDRVVPIEASQFIANQIPKAHLETAETEHLIPWLNPAWACEKLHSFHHERGPAE